MEAQNKYHHYRFPGQRSDETIRLLIRKHWIVDVKVGLVVLLFGFLPLLITSFLKLFVWTGFDDTSLTILLFFDLYLLAVLGLTYTEWLNDELDVIIVTDSRIISHEQVDMFHRQVSEAHLGQIQDVTGTQEGMLQNLLDYGTVEVQTSSADVFFILRYAEEPYESARLLLDLRDRALKVH